MVRLFVSDIDGCLSEPFRPFDLETLSRIRDLVAEGSLTGVPDVPPAFTICTGRPLGYAEAMAQLLGVQLPILFEAGAGLYDPVSGVRRWHPAFDQDLSRSVEDIQTWLETRVPGTGLAVDRGKHTQAGLIGASLEEIARELPIVRAFVSQNFPAFTVAHTSISIDIMATNLTKREGLMWLSEELSLDRQEMAFIGDTNGDLGGLRWVGTSFAPTNATEEVRGTVDKPMAGDTAHGVLQAYRECILINASHPAHSEQP